MAAGQVAEIKHIQQSASIREDERSERQPGQLSVGNYEQTRHAELKPGKERSEHKLRKRGNRPVCLGPARRIPLPRPMASLFGIGCPAAEYCDGLINGGRRPQ
jgi:hypothetical protein